MITGMKNPLSQLVRRIAEREALEDSGDLVFDTDQYFTKNLLQSVRENCKRNGYVIIDSAVIRVTLITADRVIGIKMSLKQEENRLGLQFYLSPLSASDLNVVVCTRGEEEPVQYTSQYFIENAVKCAVLPLEDDLIALPLLHH